MESPSVENRDSFSLDEKTQKALSASSCSEKRRRIFFETKSLAEVYAKQGHMGMALEIYERIRKKNPSDRQVEKRIAELKNHPSVSRGMKNKDKEE